VKEKQFSYIIMLCEHGNHMLLEHATVTVTCLWHGIGRSRILSEKNWICQSQSVSLFLIHGHSSERIWTEFGVWHPYTLQMITGWLVSAVRTCSLALRTLSIYAAANGWRVPSGNSELAGGRHEECPSTIGGRVHLLSMRNCIAVQQYRSVFLRKFGRI